MDNLLSLMIEGKYTDKQLAEKSFDKKFIDDLRNKIKASEFKRKPTITPGD